MPRSILKKANAAVVGSVMAEYQAAKAKVRRSILLCATAENIKRELSGDKPTSLFEIAAQGNLSALLLFLKKLQQLVVDKKITDEQLRLYFTHGDTTGFAVIVAACQSGNGPMVRYLVEHGFETGVTDTSAMPVALIACQHQMINVAVSLLNRELTAGLQASVEYLTDYSVLSRDVAQNHSQLLLIFITQVFMPHYSDDLTVMDWQALLKMTILVGNREGFDALIGFVADSSGDHVKTESHWIAYLKEVDAVANDPQYVTYAAKREEFRRSILQSALQNKQYGLLFYCLQSNYHKSFSELEKRAMLDGILQEADISLGLIHVLLATGFIKSIRDDHQAFLTDRFDDDAVMQTLFPTLDVVDGVKDKINVLISDFKAAKNVDSKAQRKATLNRLCEALRMLPDCNHEVTRRGRVMPLYLYVLAQCHDSQLLQNPEEYKDLLKVFVQQGANLDWQEAKSGRSALAVAINKKWPIDVLTWFTDNGADIHVADRRGVGLYHYAAQEQHWQFITKLANIGVDLISAADKDGVSALTRAVRSLSVEGVLLLLSCGAIARPKDMQALYEALEVKRQLYQANGQFARIETTAEKIRVLLGQAMSAEKGAGVAAAMQGGDVYSEHESSNSDTDTDICSSDEEPGDTDDGGNPGADWLDGESKMAAERSDSSSPPPRPRVRFDGSASMRLFCRGDSSSQLDLGGDRMSDEDIEAAIAAGQFR